VVSVSISASSQVVRVGHRRGFQHLEQVEQPGFPAREVFLQCGDVQQPQPGVPDPGAHGPRPDRQIQRVQQAVAHTHIAKPDLPVDVDVEPVQDERGLVDSP
jgi:hypothetical protein